MKRKSFTIRIADIILIICLILAAASIYIFSIIKNNSGSPEKVIIYVHGKVYGEYDLNFDQEIKIETDSGLNIISIENGKVDMIQADCPDKYCVKADPISKNSESIICLPHRVVVTLETEDDGGVDAVVQ